jgi:uncharacterized delta-60 repeat protein
LVLEPLEDRCVPAAGALDPSFGVGGVDDSASDVLIQPDGKIVAAGTAMARYNSNGSLDTSFGAMGKVTTAGGIGWIAAIALQSDGKIVAVAGDPDTRLARYEANGALDVSFGSGGTVVADLGNPDGATDVALQSDGTILVAGFYQPHSPTDDNQDFLLARFLAD